jgi:RNA polymerase-binding transcription factor DksA
MSPASKVTAEKTKVPVSRSSSGKEAVATKKSAPKKAAAAEKQATSTKKSVGAQAAGKKAPATKGVAAKKETTIVKNAAVAAKRTAPAPKRTAPATKKTAPAAKKDAPETKKPETTAANTVGPEVEADVAPVPARTTFTPKPKPPAPVRPKTGPYAKDLKFLEEIEELLLEERGIYQEQATSLRAEADSLALEREPGDVQFDEESGEGGTVTVDRERNLALSGQAALAVEEIDYATLRVADRTYGYCERCFQPIPKPRLRALPYARLCVACKSGGLSRR